MANDYEKEMLKGTLNADELLREEANEQQPEYTEEQLLVLRRKEYATKLKLIALNNLGYYVLTNPSTLVKKKKDEVLREMQRLHEQFDEETITKTFNNVCIEHLFSPGVDYSNFPIYSNDVFFNK